eukprot:TRINITY_DN2792_c0_g1_i1.p1 TRINITY_DN2792_c0_g1~~TRINITY_DN2792_c0_g1_i1.p1  ORF type:complete len:142 (+),score=5.17 TRINITY_DN2792_c0_g1_i1:145-570(+)
MLTLCKKLRIAVTARKFKFTISYCSMVKGLQWAPEPRLGFEMMMLRLLVFEPAGSVSTQESPSTAQPIQNKIGRASTLRDIINKNKTVQQSPSAEANPEIQPSVSDVNAGDKLQSDNNIVSENQVEQNQKPVNNLVKSHKQ